MTTIISKIFTPIIDVWQYTLLSIFLSIGLIIWEFTRNKQTAGKQSVKNQKNISFGKINSNVSEELKNSIISTEVIENVNQKEIQVETPSEIIEEDIITENPFQEIIEITEKQSITPLLRDTEQIVVLEEPPTGFFLENDLPDELFIEDVLSEDAIAITEEIPPSTEQITEILYKIQENIPLDEEEIGIYEYYFNKQSPESSEKGETNENIFAEY